MLSRFTKALFFLPLLFILNACMDEIANESPTDEEIDDTIRYFSGNSQDISTSTSFGLVLMGGGSEVDQAMQWMINKSGGGDFVVIRARGAAGFNPYIMSFGNVNSVTTLIIDSRDKANRESNINRIRNAEALFIAGGDQAEYVEFWKDTALEDAIQFLAYDKKVPIGGTSAGLAILGEYFFGATAGTVMSDEMLSNPYNRYTQGLGRDFLTLPFMERTITDSHFSERGREGRLLGFMARLALENSLEATQIRGIGVDERTALVIDEEGKAKALGRGGVYMVRGNVGLPEICEQETPLTWNHGGKAIRAYRLQGDSFGLDGAAVFDMTTFRPLGTSFQKEFWFSVDGIFGRSVAD